MIMGILTVPPFSSSMMQKAACRRKNEFGRRAHTWNLGEEL